MLVEKFSIQNKNIVITGAGKGIGKSIAEHFAELGANVACLARSQDDLQTLAQKINAQGGTALPVPCDVTDEKQVSNAAQQVIERFGSIDGLVNNAGGPGHGWGPIEKVDMTRFESTLRLNLSSAFAVSRAYIGELKKSRGAIVNISSAMSWIAENNLAAYGAAKAGLNQLTRLLAYELAPLVRVNGISPGAIETPGFSGAASSESDREMFSRWIPMKCIGQPEDIAAAVLFLISDASSFITGKILDVDGGIVALPGSAIERNFEESKADH